MTNQHDESQELSEFEFDDFMSIGDDGMLVRWKPNEVLVRWKPNEGRKVVSIGHDGKRYIVKTHSGVGWGEIVKNLGSLRLPVLGVENEVRGIRHLKMNQISTAEIVRYDTRKRFIAGFLPDPARHQSFLVTKNISQAINLEDLFKDKKFFERNAIKLPDKIRLKRWLIEQLAQTARILHSSGANHRSLYLKNFLLQRTDESHEPTPENSNLFLIGLRRMMIHVPTITAWFKAICIAILKLQRRVLVPERIVPSRWRMRDVAALHYSSMDIGLTKRDLIRFIATYENISNRQVLETLQDNDSFWRDVQSRAHNLYRSETSRAQQLKH